MKNLHNIHYNVNQIIINKVQNNKDINMSYNNQKKRKKRKTNKIKRMEKNQKTRVTKFITTTTAATTKNKL